MWVSRPIWAGHFFFLPFCAPKKAKKAVFVEIGCCFFSKKVIYYAHVAMKSFRLEAFYERNTEKIFKAILH